MFYFINKRPYLHVGMGVVMLFFSFFLIFTRMTFFLPTTPQPFYSCLYGFSLVHPVASSFIVVAVLLLTLWLFERFFYVNDLFDKQSFFPVIVYLLFSLLSGSLVSITPSFFVVPFILIILLLNSNYENESIKSRTYMSGLLIGIASLFDITAVLLLFFVVIMLVVNRFDKIKEIILCFFGLLTTAIYYVAYYFFTDQLPQLAVDFQHSFVYSLFSFVDCFTVGDYIKMPVIIVFCLYAIVIIKLFFDNRLIVMRKRAIMIHILLAVTLLMIMLSSYSFSHPIVYLFLPVSAYITLLAQIPSNRLFKDFMILLILATACL